MKYIQFLSYFIIVFSFFLSIYILFLLYYPPVPVKFFNSPFPVITKKVKQGENLLYTVKHCKYVNTVATISRTLVDSIQYTLPEVTSSVPKGCGTRNIMTIVIPKIIPLGKYYMDITLTYHLNPLRTHTANVRTQTFEVIKAD